MRVLARPSAAYLLGLGLSLGLAACSSNPTAAAPSPAAPSPAISVPSPTVAAPSPTPQESTDPGDPDTPGRIGGGTLALPGVRVLVGKPTRQAASGGAGSGPGTTRTGNQVAVFPVIVTSTGTKPIDMTLTAVNAYAGGEQLDGLSDGDYPADNHFSGTLLPGKTKKATFAYVLRKTDTDLQVEVYIGGGQGAAHGIFVSGDGTT